MYPSEDTYDDPPSRLPIPPQDRCRGSCGAIWRWEEAGESLRNALAVYQRSCAFLESSLMDSVASKDLVSRIGPSLKTFHVEIANELVQSRLTLVRIHNKLSSCFHSLPKNILAQIFMDVVYVPTPKDRDRSMPSILRRVYTRLHSLLGVCTTWRDAGINHQPLWSIIPIHEGWFGRTRYMAPRLSIQRSTASRYSNTGIHLAALISREYGAQVPLIDGRTPKFDTVSILSKSARAILHLLDDLARPQGPWPTYQNLSELSIYQDRENRKRCKGPKEYPDMFYDCIMYSTTGGRRNLLLDLFKSLSILRIRGATVLWNQIKLSNQLVELHLHSVVFSSDSKFLDFLRVLNSAPELRGLKIISVISFPEPSSDSFPPPQPAQCSLPKLQTLLLQDLDYNVLQILQASLAPGSYRTTLCLTEEATFIHSPRKEPKAVDLKDLCRLLKRISVDKLVFSAEWEENEWLNHTGLRKILQALPMVKTLIMSFWKFRKEDLLALERPRGKGSRTAVRFPSLTALFLEEARMLDAEPLKKVVSSHKVQKMSLNGYVAPASENCDSDSDDDIDVNSLKNADKFADALRWDQFELNDEIVEWIQTQVADFYLEDVPEVETRDYDHGSEWQLW